MEYYDALNYSTGTHTCKITFQQGEYKGTVLRKIGGNTKGMSILENSSPENFEESGIASFLENEVNLTYSESTELYSLCLANNEGDQLFIEQIENKELCNMVVAVEIIDFSN
ncbi:TPA: DUF5406 family protein [Enterococcus faecium]